MSFKKPDENDWQRALGRVLISGAPNSGKTYSSRTWPRPIHVVSLPGESGSTSIPREDGIQAYVWGDNSDSRTSSKAVLDEVQSLVIDIIAGKHGECKTIFLDGLHKLYGHVLNMVTSGDYFKANDFEALLYSRAHTRFLDLLRLVKDSAVPYAAFAVWEGKEADKPELKSRSPVHTWPDLPGRLSKLIVGEFSFVLASRVIPSLIPGKPSRYVWQLRPKGDIQGASMKLAPSIADQLPDEVDQNWIAFERLIMEAAKKAVVDSAKK